MADWTEGYVADIDYAFSYCQELNPSRTNLALLGRGIVPPKIETACELGFGQGLGTVMHAAVQDEETIARAKPQTDRLNGYLTARACDNADIAYLASPVTGGGIPVGRIPQIFLSAQRQGRKQPADWVEMVWPILAAQGQMIVKDGKALESKEENCKELLVQANAFAQGQIPILKALQVV